MSKLRCVNTGCGKIFAIADEKLRPYQGRLVAVKCPHCATAQKFRVPKAAPSRQEQIATELFANNKQAGTWKLQILPSSETPAAEILLKEGENHLGRYAKLNDNPLNRPIYTTDMQVSRNHACIKLVRNRLGIFRAQLYDLNSKNKTMLNDQPLKKGEIKYLHDGDLIKLGPSLQIRVQFLPEG